MAKCGSCVAFKREYDDNDDRVAEKCIFLDKKLPIKDILNSSCCALYSRLYYEDDGD